MRIYDRNYEFDVRGKCLICKKDFKSDACPHSVKDIDARIEQIRFDDKITKFLNRKEKKALACQQKLKLLTKDPSILTV